MNESRSKINKKNGKLAKGTKSPDGIEKSARNATIHGVYSKVPPLAGSDDHEAYQAIKQGLIEEFQATKASEVIAVESATMALIRLGRLYRAESALIERQQHERETQRMQRELSKAKPKNDLTLLYERMENYEEVTPEQQSLIDELEAQLEARSRVQFDDDCVVEDDAKQLRFMREERHLQNILDRNLAKLEASRERRENAYITQLEATIQPD